MTIRKPAPCWNTRIAIVAVALICSLAMAIPAQAQNAEPPAWATFKDEWKNVTSYSDCCRLRPGGYRSAEFDSRVHVPQALERHCALHCRPQRRRHRRVERG